MSLRKININIVGLKEAELGEKKMAFWRSGREILIVFMVKRRRMRKMGRRTNSEKRSSRKVRIRTKKEEKLENEKRTVLILIMYKLQNKLILLFA